MAACHTKPFIQPGVVIMRDLDDAATRSEVQEQCDYCGSARLEWRKCKLICVDCRQINKSCADL